MANEEMTNEEMANGERQRKEFILSTDHQAEYFTEERCFIFELTDSLADEALSLARARVERGVTTALHRLNGVAERYVILAGQGRVEVGNLPPRDVSPGDVVLIPPDISQRISNTGASDLVFLCICTPPFRPECYEDLETTSDS